MMQRSFVILLLALTLLVCLALPSSSAMQQDPRGNPNIRVWVDTQYGFYHCPNTQWYGNTRQGVYMTQRQAQARGYRPAFGAVCR